MIKEKYRHFFYELGNSYYRRFLTQEDIDDLEPNYKLTKIKYYRCFGLENLKSQFFQSIDPDDIKVFYKKITQKDLLKMTPREEITQQQFMNSFVQSDFIMANGVYRKKLTLADINLLKPLQQITRTEYDNLDHDLQKLFIVDGEICHKKLTQDDIDNLPFRRKINKIHFEPLTPDLQQNFIDDVSPDYYVKKFKKEEFDNLLPFCSISTPEYDSLSFLLKRNFFRDGNKYTKILTSKEVNDLKPFTIIPTTAYDALTFISRLKNSFANTNEGYMKKESIYEKLPTEITAIQYGILDDNLKKKFVQRDKSVWRKQEFTLNF